MPSQCNSGQNDEQGLDHSAAYFSHKLLPREENYSTIEKECLAINLGIEPFKVYLIGKMFTIQTDHCALKWLNRLKKQILDLQDGVLPSNNIVTRSSIIQDSRMVMRMHYQDI